jgi:hypothetical protein
MYPATANQYTYATPCQKSIHLICANRFIARLHYTSLPLPPLYLFPRMRLLLITRIHLHGPVVRRHLDRLLVMRVFNQRDVMLRRRGMHLRDARLRRVRGLVHRGLVARLVAVRLVGVAGRGVRIRLARARLAPPQQEAGGAEEQEAADDAADDAADCAAGEAG